MMKDTIFSCSFYVVRFGCWSIRPTTASGIVAFFKDIATKAKKGKFQWQEGYGAFSFAKSQRDIVIKYIMNQEDHHSTKTFKEEYIKMLTDFDVAFEDRYLFEFYE